MQNQSDFNGDATRRHGNGQIALVGLSNDSNGVAEQLCLASAAARNAGTANSPASTPQMSTSAVISAA
jgi:hypothetical protein